ncbi:Molybdopterin or thiamine biosynthesis adenylyltransferase [Nitrosomonas marina]|uniref:Molybdopterin-synthase adenylyltransferase n=1 Tax=Nitrosomonas marina TaxID=917 RepID=A0A1I0DSK3_9PROT|nr:HesA/MoeB/ThiF family protein [Nitrosomonas marina]SET35580.1 Molybdopterin or thiamine biosynthesis adenylyltransferase [Nitrosomonas marina]
MNDHQLLRYSRHILLPEIDISGQETLLKAHVLIIGAGGLGSPAALYLAASGIGKLTICDGDSVDLTNLQRQIVHPSSAVGLLKAHSAQTTLSGLNPEINIAACSEYANEANLQQLVAGSDAVIDASDNFETRHNINKACVENRKPLISGAAVRFEAQVSVFDLRSQRSPCYHCLYPLDGETGDMPCAIMGVFSPLVGIIGSIQAAETIKTLLRIGETLNGRLQLLNGLTMNWRTIKLKKDPYCRICQHK